MAGAVYRDRKVGKQVGNCPDVVLVTVGYEHAHHAVLNGLEIVKVRTNDVDSMIVRGKRGTAVHDQNTLGVLQRETVHTDFSEPAERYDAKVRGVGY